MPAAGEPVGGPVRAAGGIVWRRAGGGREVLLVYRRSHDDWSFPKGKVEPGESEEVCALREVEEETGLRCTLGAPLGVVEYRDRRGRPKTVRYWLMDVEAGEFVAGDEVDELRWLGRNDAVELLTNEHDRELVRSAV